MKTYKLTDGKTWTAAEVVELTGLSITTIRCRLNRTDDVEEVFATKPKPSARKGKHKLYTLSDGTNWTVPEIAKHTGLTQSSSSARLYRTRDADTILAPKQSPDGKDTVKLSKTIKDRMCFGDRDHWLLLATHT